MNIENNLGKAWSSTGLCGTAVVSELQNTNGGLTENIEQSAFQNLIFKMMLQRNPMIEKAGENLNAGAQSEIGETVKSNGESKEAAWMDGGVEPAAPMQNLLFGLTNDVLLSNSEKVFFQTQNGKPQAQNMKPQTQNGKPSAEVFIAANRDLRIPGDTGIPGDVRLTCGSGIPGDKLILPENQNYIRIHERKDVSSGKMEVPLKGMEVSKNIAADSGKERTIIAPENNFSETLQFERGKLRGETQVAEREPVHFMQNNPDYLSPLQSTGPANDAPALNHLTQSAEAPEPHTQISEEILAKLEQKGPAEFKMQLEPGDLGQIDIKLKLNDGKLIIDILAANSKTQALLTSQVDKLILSMGLQNVQVESVQVGQQMNSQSQDSQNQGYPMNSGMDFSQRKQQEHFQKEFLNGGSLPGVIDPRQNETQVNNTANRIESFRYGSQRMNYAV